MGQLFNIIIAIVLVMISGFGDALGFTFASRSWQNGHVVVSELLKSIVSFAAGISVYLYSIRYMSSAGLQNPELQTLGWFVMVVITNAIVNQSFQNWPMDVRIALVIAVGALGYIIFRTGG